MHPKSFINRLGALFLAGILMGGWLAWKWFENSGRIVGSPELVVSERQLMGTRWVIQVAHTNHLTRSLIEKHVQAAFDEVARVESVMSEWQPDSPISAVNDMAGNGAVEVPGELRELILRAVEISEKSHGAFDITWKGIGDLWDFRNPVFVPPDAEAIQKALPLVDYQKIHVDQKSVGLEQPGMQIGLGGIAKGYGIDRAGRVLRDKGLNHFYIDGGGDILVSGQKHGRPWRIAVKHPRKESNQLMGAVEMSDGAIVTSGDYENYRIHNGTRYHHILDPRTATPAQTSQSVTVIAPKAETADALATAAFVLGPEEGLRLISRYSNTDAMLVDAKGNSFFTDGFRKNWTAFERGVVVKKME